jgi:cell division protein FtsZ
MGELVLPKQGVHEAFSAADRMISDSITAVGRLVLRPGLINVGLDELISALKTTRSRCLFGSGLGRGENRAQSALKAALSSPLLDRGSLLEDATTVLVHICGGDDMTLYEVELLMQGLTKYIPENAHLLFGAATDKQMKDALSVTIISALPEDRLQAVPFVGEVTADDEPVAKEVTKEEEAPFVDAEPEPEPEPELADEAIGFVDDEPEGLEDEDSEESSDEENDADAAEESLMEEEEIDLEADSADDFADPKLKGESDKEDPEPEIIKLEVSKSSGNQGELLLEGAPKGRFDGESPNVDKDGEDLDVPPYLRKRGRRR